MSIEIVCFPDCDVKHLEINLIFNQAVLLHHKKSRKKFKYLGNEKSF